MAATDGLIVRLRLTCGILAAATAHALADLAEVHGNGRFDLTGRANLQMRGVTAGALPALHDALRGFGLVDVDVAAEAVRNVVASPLVGLHDGPDIFPLVVALEARLAGTPALHALPGKFGFLVDDGSAPSLADVAADVRFDWTDDAFAVGLGGTRDQAIPLGTCVAADLVENAETVARGALALFARVPGAARMRTLIEAIGARAVVAACRTGRGLPSSLVGEGARRADEGSAPGRAASLPTRRDSSGDIPSSVLALDAPYGRLDAGQLRLAADLAAAGPGELRLTPWRSLLAPGAADPVARERAARAGFIVDGDDPRRAVAACVGAPECARATNATRVDADALADLAAGLGPGTSLHVSGCAKGCAHAGPTRATLVGRDGRYDLVLDGRADDPPTLHGLDRAATRAALEALRPA